MGESKIRFGTALLAVGALAVLLMTAIACSASDEEEAAPAAAAPAAAAPAAAAPAAAAPAAAAPAPAPAPAPKPAAAKPAPATKPAPAAKTKNVYGREMPADAAPMGDQFLKMNYNREGEALEFAVSVYNSAAGGFQSGFSLALLSTDLSTVPGSATGWSSSDDMKTWTFNLDKDLKWSDGVPVTAHDFVYTWQYYADPEHAYDFTWYFGMLEVENYGAVSKGEEPKEALGVEATDDYTLVFHLDTPAPYVPGFMMYGTPLAKHQAEKHGYYYSNDPATALSSNPWQLKEWIPNQHAEYEPNVNYTGSWLPYVENLKKVYGERSFDQYLAGEIDTVNGPFSPADQEYLMGDSNLLKERGLSPGDFRTHYLFFDFQSEPFNDLKVRQAFAKAIDRQSIMKNVVGEAAGEPRYGILIPGFPDAAGPDLLKKYQGFDAAAAKQLMADAGFADGAGFPKLELALRSESEIGQAAAAAVAQSLKKHINVDVTINNMDRKTYMAGLNGHNLTFAMVSYGFDYVDASNFMGVFKTDGRHNWNNKEFEDLRIEAGAMSLSPERSAKMIKLQEILSEDVGSLFFWSQIQNQLHKPYLKGPWRETNKAGWTGLQYPNWNTGFGAQNIYEVYIGDNVSDFARSAY